MNKTPHEKCAEEIVAAMFDSYPTVEQAKQVLTKHFPQPTPTPSLDEVVENPKAQPSIYGLLSYLQHQYPATCGDLQLREFCRGLLARHASLVAEVEKLNKRLDEYAHAYDQLSSIRMDEKADIAKRCGYHWDVNGNGLEPWIAADKLREERDQLRTQLSTADQLRAANDRLILQNASLKEQVDNLVQTRTPDNEVMQQISTADRTGYERGLREAAELVYSDNPLSAKTRILNLLNKKD